VKKVSAIVVYLTVALVLFFSVNSHHSAVHEHFHVDEHEADHQCAFTAFSNSLIEISNSTVETAIPNRFAFIVFEPIQFVLLPEAASFHPPRAPPV
jgi:hypothetical protein